MTIRYSALLLFTATLALSMATVPAIAGKQVKPEK